MKYQLVQLAELADQLDTAGMKAEADAIDQFIKEAMRAEVESGMDMLIQNLLMEMSEGDILRKVKDKIEKIRGRKPSDDNPSYLTQAK